MPLRRHALVGSGCGGSERRVLGRSGAPRRSSGGGRIAATEPPALQITRNMNRPSTGQHQYDADHIDVQADMSRSTAKVRIAPTAIKKMLAPIPIVVCPPGPEPRGCAVLVAL
jgi:hypothetical protein